MRRAWKIFSVVAVVLIALQLAYMKWRERSLEPLSEIVDLSRTGQYSFDVSGFHASRYHPEIRLQLPFTLEDASHFNDDEYAEIWHGPAPRVHIVVRDREGRVVLDETSDLTRHDDWTATYGLGGNEVELYKLLPFEPRMLRSYRVSLDVLRGNERARIYQPRFEIATIKAYLLMVATFGLMLLLLGLAVVALILLAVQVRRARRARRAEAAA